MYILLNPSLLIGWNGCWSNSYSISNVTSVIYFYIQHFFELGIPFSSCIFMKSFVPTKYYAKTFMFDLRRCSKELRNKKLSFDLQVKESVIHCFKSIEYGNCYVHTHLTKVCPISWPSNSLTQLLRSIICAANCITDWNTAGIIFLLIARVTATSNWNPINNVIDRVILIADIDQPSGPVAPVFDGQLNVECCIQTLVQTLHCDKAFELGSSTRLKEYRWQASWTSILKNSLRR